MGEADVLVRMRPVASPSGPRWLMSSFIACSAGCHCGTGPAREGDGATDSAHSGGRIDAARPPRSAAGLTREPPRLRRALSGARARPRRRRACGRSGAPASGVGGRRPVIAEGGVDRLGEPPVGVPPAEADVLVRPGRDLLESLRHGRLGEHVLKIGEIGTDRKVVPVRLQHAVVLALDEDLGRPGQGSLEMAWTEGEERWSSQPAGIRGDTSANDSPVRPRASPRPPCAAHRAVEGAGTGLTRRPSARPTARNSSHPSPTTASRGSVEMSARSPSSGAADARAPRSDT